MSPIGCRRVWTYRSTEAGSDKAAVPQMTSVVFWRWRDKILLIYGRLDFLHIL